MYRVSHFGPGSIGRSALRTIITDPRMELIGLRVYSPGKEGLDAGELCGLPAVGVRATRDVDALLELETDCVVYTGADWYGGDEVVEEVCRILRAGINVTGSSPTTMLLPSSAPETAARVEAACKAGGSSFHVTGISPGFMDDYLPTKLATGCVSFDRIDTEEIFCILPFYEDPSLLNNIMGIGNRPDVEDTFRDTRLRFAEFVWKASPASHGGGHERRHRRGTNRLGVCRHRQANRLGKREDRARMRRGDPPQHRGDGGRGDADHRSSLRAM